MITGLRMETLRLLYSTTQPIGVTDRISKKEGPMLIKK